MPLYTRTVAIFSVLLTLANPLAAGAEQCVSRLPATGQTTSYAPEDDAAQRRGAPLSYTDNGNGTITDNNTHLVWEKKNKNNNDYGFGVATSYMFWTSTTHAFNPLDGWYLCCLRHASAGGGQTPKASAFAPRAADPEVEIGDAKAWT